jgi:hypothetical protein
MKAIALALLVGCVPTNHWVASTTAPAFDAQSDADCMDACLIAGVPNVRACAQKCNATVADGGCTAPDRGADKLCRTGDEHASTGWFLVGLVAVTAFVVTAAVVTENPFGIHTVSPSTGLR